MALIGGYVGIAVWLVQGWPSTLTASTREQGEHSGTSAVYPATVQHTRRFIP